MNLSQSKRLSVVLRYARLSSTEKRAWATWFKTLPTSEIVMRKFRARGGHFAVIQGGKTYAA